MINITNVSYAIDKKWYILQSDKYSIYVNKVKFVKEVNSNF